MAKNQNIAHEIKQQAEKSISNNKLGFGIFSLAFISVFREVIETILFLYGIFIKEGNVSIILSLLGGLLGLGMGYLIFIKGKEVPVKTFFNFSSILLIFVASGMLTYGVHELESAGVIKDYGRIWDINPELNLDGSYPLFHEKGNIGGFFKGILGYNGNPSLIEFLTWIISLNCFFYFYNRFKTVKKNGGDE